MAIFYTKAQVDQQAGVIGQRLKTLKSDLTEKIDQSKLTPEEREKLASLESSKFLGVYLTSSAIPTEGAVAGNYADVDAGLGEDAERWIFDPTDNKFVKATALVAGETSASIKEKYEANPNTNTFTDADKAKLDGLVKTDIEYATSIDDFLLALTTAMEDTAL